MSKLRASFTAFEDRPAYEDRSGTGRKQRSTSGRAKPSQSRGRPKQRSRRWAPYQRERARWHMGWRRHAGLL
eukprot:5427993-Pleurochrysis_carterae.AAC.3